jgi:hypothetical protein
MSDGVTVCGTCGCPTAAFTDEPNDLFGFRVCPECGFWRPYSPPSDSFLGTANKAVLKNPTAYSYRPKPAGGTP